MRVIRRRQKKVSTHIMHVYSSINTSGGLRVAKGSPVASLSAISVKFEHERPHKQFSETTLDHRNTPSSDKRIQVKEICANS